VKKKAALVVGARPQFIKTAPLVMELGRFFEIILIHTGQHYDFMMSDTFFEELNLPDPDYHLGVSWAGDGKQTARMMEGLDNIFSHERSDLTIAVGEKNSTLAGAIASSKLRIPVAHIEAGVRSKDKYLPEQINRVITDSISDCFLCPTPSSVENLDNEGKTDNVYDTGDILYDCLRLFKTKIEKSDISKFELPARYALITVHRADAVDKSENLKKLLSSLSTLSIPALFPIHPRTRKMIDKFGLWNDVPPGIRIIDPVGYIDLLSLIKAAEFVITDSGGVQREAAFFKKPVILAREESEWVELVSSGSVMVKGYKFDMSEQPVNADSDYSSIKHLFRSSAAEMVEILNSIY